MTKQDTIAAMAEALHNEMTGRPELWESVGKNYGAWHVHAQASLEASGLWELLEIAERALELVKSHVSELREAWRSGALNECDGLGGTRSSRNVDVGVAVYSALAAIRLPKPPQQPEV